MDVPAPGRTVLGVSTSPVWARRFFGWPVSCFATADVDVHLRPVAAPLTSSSHRGLPGGQEQLQPAVRPDSASCVHVSAVAERSLRPAASPRRPPSLESLALQPPDAHWVCATLRVGRLTPQGPPVLVQPPRAPWGLGGPRSDGCAGLLCVCVGSAGGNHHFLRPGWQTGSLSAPPRLPPHPGGPRRPFVVGQPSVILPWSRLGDVRHGPPEPWAWGVDTRPCQEPPLSDPGTPTCALNAHNLPTSRGHFPSAGGSGPRPHPLPTWSGRLTWSTALVKP